MPSGLTLAIEPGAISLMSKAGKDLVATMQQMEHGSSSPMNAANKLDPVAITSEKIEDDRATVEAVIHNKDGSTSNTTFRYLKADGKWEVSSGM